jgi:glycosidase
MRYSDQVNDALLNLLDSHDTERFLYTAKEDKKALMNAAAFLFAYKGMPCTYYGTEIKMTGCYDPGCRKGFDWRQENWDMELFGYYKKLIAVRKAEKALKYGRIEFLSTDQLLVMKRTFEEETIYILINNSESEQEFTLPDNDITQAEELIRGNQYNGAAGKLTIPVPEASAFYIRPVRLV